MQRQQEQWLIVHQRVLFHEVRVIITKHIPFKNKLYDNVIISGL